MAKDSIEFGLLIGGTSINTNGKYIYNKNLGGYYKDIETDFNQPEWTQSRRLCSLSSVKVFSKLFSEN